MSEDNYSFLLASSIKSSLHSREFRLNDDLNFQACVHDYDLSLNHLAIAVHDFRFFFENFERDPDMQQFIGYYTYHISNIVNRLVSIYDKSIHLVEVALFGSGLPYLDKNGERKEWMKVHENKEYTKTISKLKSKITHLKPNGCEIDKINVKRNYFEHAGVVVPLEMSLILLCKSDNELKNKALIKILKADVLYFSKISKQFEKFAINITNSICCELKTGALKI